YLRDLQGGRKGGRGRSCSSGEIGINILIGDQQSLRVPGARRTAAFVADDFGNDKIRVGGRAHGQPAGRKGSETILSEVGEPVVGGGLKGRCLDDARGHKIEIAETQIVARIERGIANEKDGLGLALPKGGGFLEK